MRNGKDLSKPEDLVELDQVGTDPRNDVSPSRKLRDTTGTALKQRPLRYLGGRISMGSWELGFCLTKREVEL